uniref:Uncharacterized protein n=1 Tax=Curvibacter symbiont subsp. Hydra magnipapillata TaxID=667019 RepID=C9YDX2_CURXX|nr:hypothetical protein Csp_D27780 [Curvibacter putative symbiont of Hydra magnipapillata]
MLLQQKAKNERSLYILSLNLHDGSVNFCFNSIYFFNWEVSSSLVCLW